MTTTPTEDRLCIGKAGSTQEETCQHGTYKETNWCAGHMIVEFGSHMVDRDDVFPDPPSTDKLDALYDAACDNALAILRDDTWYVKYTESSELNLGIIDRWLQRREADRQYELATAQRKPITLPYVESERSFSDYRGGIGVEVQCPETYQPSLGNLQYCEKSTGHEDDHHFVNMIPDVPAQDSP